MYDFDISCTTNNQQFIDGIIKNGLPITYTKKTAPKETIKQKQLYKSDGKAFNSKIGFITNCSTTMDEMITKYEENSLEYRELEKRLKLCRVAQGNEIDKAKGVETKPFPRYWTKKSKGDDFNNSLVIEKRPYFMHWLYPNYNSDYKKFIANYENFSLFKFGCEINEITNEQKETKEYKDFIKKYNRENPLLETNGTMNRICRYMENQCSEIKKSQKKNNFDYSIYFNKSFEIDNDKLNMVDIIFKDYLKYKKDTATNLENNTNGIREFLDRLYEISYNPYELTNLCIELCYGKYPKKPKDFVWDMFGNEIVDNIIQNKGMCEIEIPLLDNNGEIEYLGKHYKLIRGVIDNETNYL